MELLQVVVTKKSRAKSPAAKKRGDAKAKQRGIDLKKWLVNMAGGKCVCCGYSKNYAALTFHHRDPTGKKMTLCAHTLSRISLEKIVAESKKCDLLCFNCHMEHHHPEYERVGTTDTTQIVPTSHTG